MFDSKNLHPKILINDKGVGKKILGNIIDNLLECEEFTFCVAFLTNGGVQSLHNTFKELEEKKVTFAATEQAINTKTPEGKCFLNMLSVFSEFETQLRRERQMDGIKANKDKFKGRGQTINIEKIKELKNKGLGATAIAKEMGIDRTSVYRLLKKVEVK